MKSKSLVKGLTVLLMLCCMGFLTYGQHLYVKTFGSSKAKPLIFIHGGPGSSAVYFEAATAQKLADEGFYVIVYDRRGEGRSADKNAKMTYQEAFDDLNSIYKKYGLTKAGLIAFSFGGLVTTLYTERYPEKVSSIVLVSALVSQQESYRTILASTKSIYQQKKDSIHLREISMIEKLDTNSLEYRTECFKHASLNGYFTLKNPDDAAKKIYGACDTDPLIINYVKNNESVSTFWKNEQRKNIDVLPVLKRLRHKNISIYALYGQQDGLYSAAQIAKVKELTGTDRLKYIANCSHTVFIDQQAEFLSALKSWIN